MHVLPTLPLDRNVGAFGPDGAWLSPLRYRKCRRGFNERTGSVLNRLQLPTDVVFLIIL